MSVLGGIALTGAGAVLFLLAKREQWRDQDERREEAVRLLEDEKLSEAYGAMVRGPRRPWLLIAAFLGSGVAMACGVVEFFAP